MNALLLRRLSSPYIGQRVFVPVLVWQERIQNYARTYRPARIHQCDSVYLTAKLNQPTNEGTFLVGCLVQSCLRV